MSLPSLAPVSALEKRLGVPVGSLAGEDLTRAETDLADASALVRAEAGLDWVADDGVTITAPESAVTVVVRAALRSFNNPEGYAGESLGSGAYSYQYGQQAQQGVYLTAAEIRIVKQAARISGGLGGVFSVRTPSAYCPGSPVDSTTSF